MALQRMVRRFTHWAYSGDTFVARWCAQRMVAMLKLVKPPPQSRIVDLGGSEFIWSLIPHKFHVTLVNMPGFNVPISDPSRYTHVVGDACDLRQKFPDHSFDMAFSNSTIEHVGDEPRQEMFAREVQRLAPAFWVQTPSNRCPLEVHTGVPLYWGLPIGMRNAMLNRWQRKLPAWTDMIRETRVLSQKRMRHLFPNAQIYIESRFCLQKSYAAYYPCK